MELIRSVPFQFLLLALALLPRPAAAAEGIAWLSDVETARARSRSEKKPIFAVFR